MEFTKLKSNKGFTIQDLVIALTIILLFTSTIVTGFITIYKMQLDTKMDSIASLFLVQIMERIDKLGYTEVAEGKLDSLISQMRSDFSIPSNFTLDIKIEQDDTTKNLVKTVHVKLGYVFQNKDRSISVKTLKVKEFEGENNEK